jgi:hypothetical protein
MMNYFCAANITKGFKLNQGAGIIYTRLTSMRKLAVPDAKIGFYQLIFMILDRH